ncbi:PEP-CTERM sorting domain-containing protein [Phycisphaerales bacterium AB-hyl4]|uniref:PEP-CTERM sorting domain-containing protein n=1 Tax=Natronomicrosphaera hydrolytica TaxID=3242702 RepID=A0ABV4U5S3_9BACT
MRRILSLMPAATLLFTIPLAHGSVVLFEENFESYAPGATTLSSSWTLTNLGDRMTNSVVNASDDAIEGDQYWRFSYPSGLDDGQPNSTMTASGWRQDDAEGVYVLSHRIYFSSTTIENSALMRPRYLLTIRDADDRVAGTLTLRALSDGNGNKQIRYETASGTTTINEGDTGYPTFWSTNDWLMVVMTVDELDRTWSFELANGNGTPIAAMAGLSLQNADFDQAEAFRMQLLGVPDTRGLNTWVDDIQITGPIPEPSSMALLGLGALAMLRRRRMRN